MNIRELAQKSENIAETLKYFQKYLDNSIDYVSIASNIKEVVMYVSKTDPYIPFHEAKKYYSQYFPSSKIREFEDKGHFNWRVELFRFPEIIEDISKYISVYTTRIDTVYGMTYAVLAPDHPRVYDFITDEQSTECEAYITESASRSDQDRTNEGKEKTGVFTGSYVINPYSGESVQLWIADYVLGHYGTGAVMAVPAHDERDFAFAKRYKLPIKQSIARLSIPEPFYAPKEGVETLYRTTVEIILENER